MDYGNAGSGALAHLLIYRIANAVALTKKV